MKKTVNIQINETDLEVTGYYKPGEDETIYPDRTGVPATEPRFEVEKVVWEKKKEDKTFGVDITHIFHNFLNYEEIENACIKNCA